MRTPELLQQGIEEFNSGELFTSHATLEALWRLSRGDARTFTQGMIQGIMGLYHATQGHLLGAEDMIRRSLAKVDQYEADYAGIDLESFRHAMRSVLRRIDENRATEGFRLEGTAVQPIRILEDDAGT